jgi:hypothetical protein
MVPDFEPGKNAKYPRNTSLCVPSTSQIYPLDSAKIVKRKPRSSGCGHCAISQLAASLSELSGHQHRAIFAAQPVRYFERTAAI